MVKISTKSSMPRLRQTLTSLAQSLEVGVFADAGMNGSISNAEAAIFFEYGTSRQPPRPWISRVMAEQSNKYAQLLADMTARVFRGTTTPAIAINELGQTAVNDIQQFLYQGKATPPLAPSTIASKGSATPGIDSGQMVSSVSYRLKETK